jgi:hypothetical protein
MEILSEEMPSSSVSAVSKPLVNTKQINPTSQQNNTNTNTISLNRLPVQLAPVPELKSSNNRPTLTKTNYNLAAFAPYGNDFTLPNRNNLDQTVQNRIEMFNNNKNK